MQLTTDLRAGFANVIEAEKAELEKAEAPEQAARKDGVSPKQIELLHTMLTERYSAEEAAQRFTQFDWTVMTRAEFRRFFEFLKGVPRIDRPAVSTAPAVEVTVPLIEGKFTVSFEDGLHKTLRVRRQSADSRFMPGRLIVGHLVGSDNEIDYTNVGHVDDRTGNVAIWKKHRGNERLAEAIRVLVGDPKAAAQAYAQISGNCAACGRTLTAPVEENPFRAVGLGPECGKRSGW